MAAASSHRQQRTSGAPPVAAGLAAPGFAGWLGILVFACIAYAVFADGAAAIHEEGRVQVALAVAAVLGGIGLATGALGFARSRPAWVGAGCLAVFALFCALSVVWSVAPDLSWIAANRAAEYALLVAVVLVVAPSLYRAPEWALGLFTALAVVAAAYALGGKMLPELAIGPIDLDQASQFARLRAPLGYWNALGMLMVMATPACIAFAAAREGAPGARIVALLALELLLVTLALTYSRGALLALAVAVVVVVAAGPDRLRRLGVAALAVLASVPPVAFAFGSDKLSHDGVAAAERATEGLELLAIFAGSMLALAAVALFALRAESGRSWSNARKRGVWRLIALFAAIAALTGIGALASSERGLTGTVSHEWKEFRTPVGISNEPVRLISSNGSNRWIWWREAAGAFSDRPLAGWGAGSFPILHDRYREYRTQVRSAHSVPLQFLAEGGVLGAALAIGAIALLFAAAIGTALSSEGADRSARMTLIASASAWAVHCLVDWDWEIPALTLAALAALAVAAAPWGADRSWTYPSPPRSRSGRRLRVSPRRGPVAIPVALLAGFAAAALAVSAALPVAADSRRLDALREAADAGVSDAALEKAADDAAEAHDLNPLDADALLAQATIEHRLGNDADARDLLLEASRVQPDDYRVWEALFGFAQITGDTELAKLALERRAAAEPLSISDDPGPSSGLAYTLAVPPEQSPTAVGTPP